MSSLQLIPGLRSGFRGAWAFNVSGWEVAYEVGRFLGLGDDYVGHDDPGHSR
jgi:hypothetical protein